MLPQLLNVVLGLGCLLPASAGLGAPLERVTVVAIASAPVSASGSPRPATNEDASDAAQHLRMIEARRVAPERSVASTRPSNAREPRHLGRVAVHLPSRDGRRLPSYRPGVPAEPGRFVDPPMTRVVDLPGALVAAVQAAPDFPSREDSRFAAQAGAELRALADQDPSFRGDLPFARYLLSPRVLDDLRGSDPARRHAASRAVWLLRLMDVGLGDVEEAILTRPDGTSLWYQLELSPPETKRRASLRLTLTFFDADGRAVERAQLSTLERASLDQEQRLRKLVADVAAAFAVLPTSAATRPAASP